MYLPKHSSWLNQIEVIFGVIMRKVDPAWLVPLGGGFMHGNMLDFVTYFNRVFAKPFRWTYTGRPLDEAQRREVGQLSKPGDAVDFIALQLRKVGLATPASIVATMLE